MLRSTPGNTEKGPADSTSATLSRQSQWRLDGTAMISVVHPPPFDQRMRV